MSIIIIPGEDSPADDHGDELVMERLYPDDLREMLREAIERNKGTIRGSKTQAAIDRVVEAALEEDEVHPGNALLLITAARVSGLISYFCQVLLQASIDAGPIEQRCRVCGCTNSRACPSGCEWVEFDLCSNCIGKSSVLGP